ncbi:MAG: WD40 repeat domain-containing serine/threonine protein kinase [Verrucomicrobiia bacterium]
MSLPQHCSVCGAEISAGKQDGLCMRCLLALGLQPASAPSAADGLAAADSFPVTGHLAILTAFGDYELLEEIARGGMGIVYKARQVSLNRIVAVKLLLEGALSNPEHIKRFRVEASAAASLQHPNIVTIHEVGVHQGQHYLVMDYVDGPSLAKLVAQQPLPPKRAADYMKTVAEAVHFAHEHGILHRDLKPSNVLLGAADQPRVTDFGLAKRFEGESEVTLSGQIVGSPGYIPPEQAAAKRGKVSRRSDVYGLGAMLYHLLTGRAPFQAATLADTLDQVLNGEPVAPRWLNPAAPRDLETIVLKCLEKEPDRRYPTALALADDLERFLKGQPVLARPVGWAGKVWRWCRRQPVRVGLIAALIAVGALGLIGVLWEWRRAELLRTSAEAEALLARRHAYGADMKEVQRALAENDLGRALDLLNRYRPAVKPEGSGQRSASENPLSKVDLRGWEWRYLWARCQSDERFILCRYSNAVPALAFSPDGKWLAARRKGGAVVLWDMVAKESVAEWPGAGRYTTLAFSPRGSLLAWGNENAQGKHSVRFGDTRSRQELAALSHPTEIVSIAFSPDAAKLATLDVTGTIRIWDLESRRAQRSFTKLEVAVASLSEGLSGGAKRMAVAIADSAAGMWEPVSGGPEFSQIAELGGHAGKVLFSPDGRLLAVDDPSPRIQLWDWVTGEAKPSVPLAIPLAGITAMAFSPDSRLIAAGCGFGHLNLHVWDSTARRGVRLAGHRGWITDLAFSPDGKTLASASTDQTLRLWDVDGKTQVRQFQGHTDEVLTLAWSPDGQNLVTGAKDGTVRFWDRAAKPVVPYAILPAEVWSYGLAFSPDSKTLLTVAPPEGGVVSWEAATLKKREHLAFLGSNHFSLDLSSDGRWLALSDANGNIQVWDFPARRLVNNFFFQAARMIGVLFSPRGHYLHAGAMSPSGDVVGKMWETATWREVNQEGINLRELRDFSLSANERTLALGHDNGTADWWEIATRRRLALFDWHQGAMIRVRFSPDGRHFAMAGMTDGRIVLWDVATREHRPIGRGYRGQLQDLIFSTDGRRLITFGTSPNDVGKIWDVETGRDVATLPGMLGHFFLRTGFSPDGNTLFANSTEGVALLWHAPSWHEIEAKEKEIRAP